MTHDVNIVWKIQTFAIDYLKVYFFQEKKCIKQKYSWNITIRKWTTWLICENKAEKSPNPGKYTHGNVKNVKNVWYHMSLGKHDLQQWNCR